MTESNLPSPIPGAIFVIKWTKIRCMLPFLMIGSLISSAAALAVHTDHEISASLEDHIELSATTDFSTLHAGDSGILAITLDIEKDWHTYWPGVSDSGFGLELDINTSESITLDEPIWPTPTRYLQPGDILDHIYEDTAVVLVPFQIASDASPDDLLVFDITIDYLVCKEICLPGKANTSTSIAIVDDSAEPTPSSSSKQIHQVYESRPKPFNPKADDVRVQWVADASAIMFRDATKIEFFPSQSCTPLSDPIVGGLTATNRLVIQFTQRTNKLLEGRLRVYERNKTIDYDIHLEPTD